MPRAKCGKSTERTVDFYLTECTTLVHVSSDYVFDGTRELHDEAEPLSPLSAYGQSKAAGDLAVAGCPAHYVLRARRCNVVWLSRT